MLREFYKTGRVHWIIAENLVIIGIKSLSHFWKACQCHCYSNITGSKWPSMTIEDVSRNISVSFRLHIHVGRNLWTRWRSNGGQALPLSERGYLDSLLPIGFVVSVGHLRSTRLWIIQLDDEWVRISSRIRFTRRRVSALPRMSCRFYRSFISHLCADTRLVGVAAPVWCFEHQSWCPEGHVSEKNMGSWIRRKVLGAFKTS